MRWRSLRSAEFVRAAAMCRSLDKLYLFLTQRIGSIDGVQSSELTPWSGGQTVHVADERGPFRSVC